MAEQELDLSPWDGIVDPVGWYSKLYSRLIAVAAASCIRALCMFFFGFWPFATESKLTSVEVSKNLNSF